MISSRHDAVLRSPLISAATQFRNVLDSARQTIAPKHFCWYPYDSLSNAVHLTELLRGKGLDLQVEVHGKRVLDLGCADGDFAFFLESLGASVTAVDHPRGNHNNLAAIRALKNQLGSRVEILEADLDTGVHISQQPFDLAIALGLLYHLKNPFQFLESLAQTATRCLLSTRVMRRLPGIRSAVSELPIAYLLAADELNADNSNFWIFTEAGLQRLFARAHWRVLASTNAGRTENSDPHTLENDERMFCLLESTWGDVGLELGYGWHQPEDTGWRWAEKRFSVHGHMPKGAAATLNVSIYVPDPLVAGTHPLVLEIFADGCSLQPQVLTSPGLHSFSRALDGSGVKQTIEINASAALPPDSLDARERSVIVESIRLQPS